MPRVCPALLSFFLDNPFRRFLFYPDRIIGPYVREGMTVADIGCGPGFFTVPMARLVGPSGRVVAVDLQQAMLDKVRRKAEEAGLEDRIALHHCGTRSLVLHEPLDFALCFWMLHEVPSPQELLKELAALMNPGALLLITEPYAHVGRGRFKSTLDAAMKTGFVLSGAPRIRGSFSALLASPRLRDP